MQTKFFEVRDCGTTIPVLAIKCNRENRFFRHASYTNEVLAIMLTTRKCEYDPNVWREQQNRTMHFAHIHMEKCWDELEDGQVIDVEYLLGYRNSPKVREIGVPYSDAIRNDAADLSTTNDS